MRERAAFGLQLQVDRRQMQCNHESIINVNAQVLQLSCDLVFGVEVNWKVL